MKGLLIILSFLCVTSSGLKAQEVYKILFLNRPSVCIGTKTLKENDTFKDNENIYWSKRGRTVMKVAGVNSHKHYVIASDMQKKTTRKDLVAYLVFNKHLSTRQGKKMTPIELKEYLIQDQILIDSLCFETTITTDDTHYFYASYTYKGELINKRLSGENGQLRIDYNIFVIDGQRITPFDVCLGIYYYDEKKEESILIGDDIKLIPAVWED